MARLLCTCSRVAALELRLDLLATMGFGALAAGAALAAVIEGLISPEVLLAAIP